MTITKKFLTTILTIITILSLSIVGFSADSNALVESDGHIHTELEDIPSTFCGHSVTRKACSGIKSHKETYLGSFYAMYYTALDCDICGARVATKNGTHICKRSTGLFPYVSVCPY